MHKMLADAATLIASRLQEASITKTSEWAEKYRVMGMPFPGAWKFDHHPWAREMCDCEEEFMVGQKAAQMAFTEVALNKTFKAIDIDGQSVLYVLPTNTPDATEFSATRFDPALEMSEHLRNLFTDVKNTRLKRAGTACLYVRGSRSRSQMKSIPAGRIIADEVEEMALANIPLLLERSSGQIERQVFFLSTPRVANQGINYYYNQTTKKHFFFRCPHCSRLTELIFPDCLIIPTEDVTSKDLLDTHIVCKECKVRLQHEDKINFLAGGIWVPQHKDRMAAGYHINQMYSMVLPPWKLGESYLNSLTNPFDEQEFHNSKLGLVHEVDGARVTDEMIRSCIGDYTKPLINLQSGLITIGIDVGQKWFHYEIDKWSLMTPNYDPSTVNMIAKPRILSEGKVRSVADLDKLIKNFKVIFGCIDVEPETRIALDFARKYKGRMIRVRYASGVSAKEISEPKDDVDNEHLVHVNRTAWLDLSLGRFKNQTISLPMDVSQEYKKHLGALVRIYDKDSNGNDVSKYVHGQSEPDHLAHSRNYNEIALRLCATVANGQDISGVY